MASICGARHQAASANAPIRHTHFSSNARMGVPTGRADRAPQFAQVGRVDELHVEPPVKPNSASHLRTP